MSEKGSKVERRQAVEAVEAAVADALSTLADEMDPLFLAAITMDLLDRQSMTTIAELVAIRLEARAYQAYQMDLARSHVEALEAQRDRFLEDLAEELEMLLDVRVKVPGLEDEPATEEEPPTGCQGDAE